MSGDILATKLFASSLRSTLVSRPRLVGALNQGLEDGYKLTLISAPAGFGKTTLVAEWLNQNRDHATEEPGDSGFRAAWLSLDNADNNLSRFLAYVIAALQGPDGGIGEAAAVMLQATQQPPMESILTSLINDVVEIERNGRKEKSTILVLDDYHLIAAKVVHDAVSFLIENMPPNFRLVLITRSDPPLPLARLRARGQMSEIRQSDLQFTGTEAAFFLNEVMGLSLSIGQIATLEARTEGWIAGLQLAALSMSGRDDIDGFVEAFGGSHRFVMDYLVEEVVQCQTDRLQEFISQTSILGRLCAPLCEAVTGQRHGQQSLEQLEESNLFLIPLDDEQNWFRYHHLFADVMAGSLQRESPELVSQLHLRAARWFLEERLFTEAIAHALSAEDFELAAEIVESQALNMLKAGNLATLLDWLNKLPPQIVNQSPRLAVAAAWVYLLIGKLEQIDPYLATAEENLIDGEETSDLRGEIAAIRTYSAAMLGQLEQAVDQAREAFALLAEDNLTVRCVVAFVLGGVHFMRRDMPQALEAMLEAGRLGEQEGNIHVAVSALSSAGDLYRRQGNFAAAEKTFYRARQIGTGRGGRPLPLTASVYAGLAALRFSQQDLAAARKNALIGLELGKVLVNPESQVRCHLTLAQVENLENDPASAREALDRAKTIAASHQLTPGLEEQIAASEKVLFDVPARTPDQGIFEPLSDHELKVLRLAAAGLSNREIAEELYLSVNTIKWHLKNIYVKLDVHSRLAAVSRAQELDIL